MPPIGKLIGGIDFSNLFINLSGKPAESLAQAKAAGLATINVGVFLNTLIDFLIIAFAIFLLVKQVNRLKKPPAPPGPTKEEQLLTEIRDLLKSSHGASAP